MQVGGLTSWGRWRMSDGHALQPGPSGHSRRFGTAWLGGVPGRGDRAFLQGRPSQEVVRSIGTAERGRGRYTFNS